MLGSETIRYVNNYSGVWAWQITGKTPYKEFVLAETKDGFYCIP